GAGEFHDHRAEHRFAAREFFARRVAAHRLPPCQARLTEWGEAPEADKRFPIGPGAMLALTGRAKSIIGMGHLKPLPGSPLYDRDGGCRPSSMRWPRTSRRCRTVASMPSCSATRATARTC